MEQTHALGRRKAAVARVYLTAGTGNVTINDRPIENYFPLDSLRYVVNQPFEVTGTLGQYDVKITICGGGIKGQAEAIRLGISRALCGTKKHTVLHSRQQASSPATPARLSARSPASPVHVAASSSANVSHIVVLRHSRGYQTILEMAALLRKRPETGQKPLLRLEEKRPRHGDSLQKTENRHRQCHAQISKNCLMQTYISGIWPESGTPRWLPISSTRRTESM